MALGRVLAGAVGLAALGGGAWPLALPLLAYAAYPLLRRPLRASGSVGRALRVALGSVLLLLSAGALASGGRASPLLLGAGGAALLLWPRLRASGLHQRWSPVAGSVLLRSSCLPFRWAVVSEVKVGSDDLPRALSAFSGSLVVNSRDGAAYAVATFNALGRGSAEARAVAEMRKTLGTGRYSPLLLPLDSSRALDSFKVRREGGQEIRAAIDKGFPHIPDVLAIRSDRGSVTAVGAYRLAGGNGQSRILPAAAEELPGPPQMWEVVKSILARVPIRPPDGTSSLLEALKATRGLPLSERLQDLDGEGAQVIAKTPSGEEVLLTRPQFRAIASVYE